MIVTYEEIIAKFTEKMKADMVEAVFGQNLPDMKAINNIWDYVFTNVAKSDLNQTSEIFYNLLVLIKPYCEKDTSHE